MTGRIGAIFLLESGKSTFVMVDHVRRMTAKKAKKFLLANMDHLSVCSSCFVFRIVMMNALWCMFTCVWPVDYLLSL